MATPQIPAIGNVSTQPPQNTLGQIFGAIGGFNQQKQDIQQDQQVKKLQLQQMQQQVQAAQQQQAQARLANFGSLATRNPSMLTDQNNINTYKQLSTDAGQPVILTPEGHIDENQFKPLWSELDPKKQESILEAPAGPTREALLSQYAGVPQEAHTADQYTSQKDRAALEHAAGYMKHIGDQEKFQRDRQQIAVARLHMDEGKASAYEQNLLSEASKRKTDAVLDQERVNAELMRISASVQNSQGRLQIGMGNLSLAQSRDQRLAAEDLLRQQTALQNAQARANDNVVKYLANGDADDPESQKLQGIADGLTKQINDNAKTFGDASKVMQSPFSGVNNVLRGASGKQVDTQSVGSAGKSVVESRVINGKTWVKYSDGTYAQQ